MLSYETTGRVGASAARKIAAEAAGLQRAWWRGGLGFDLDEAAGPAVLSGATPLFHTSKHIPVDDDLFLAFADAAFILERLEDWARRFKVKWHVRMRDEDWGAVDPSGPTRPLLDQMEKWARRVGVPATGKGTWRIDESRRAELLARHAGRPGA